MPSIQEKLNAKRQEFREEGVKAFIPLVHLDIHAKAEQTQQNIHQGPLEKQEMKKEAESVAYNGIRWMTLFGKAPGLSQRQNTASFCGFRRNRNLFTFSR